MTGKIHPSVFPSDTHIQKHTACIQCAHSTHTSVEFGMMLLLLARTICGPCMHTGSFANPSGCVGFAGVPGHGPDGLEGDLGGAWLGSRKWQNFCSAIKSDTGHGRAQHHSIRSLG